MAELFPRTKSRRRSARGSGFNDREEKPKRDSGLFVWTIFILLLVALVAVCWMGTIHVFGHPESPLGYSVMQRFKKLDPPQRFSEIGAPKGEFLDAKKLLAKYGQMSPRQLKNESDTLLRNFIRNYNMPGGLVPYITGRFSILDSYELTKKDFFESGVVALAQDTEVPQVLIENVFTTSPRMVQSLYRSLLTGLDIPIRRSLDLSPIIHIEKLPDGRLKFTTVPIQYPNYSAAQGPGGFSLEPPTILNVQAGLPILSNSKVQDADRHYATYRSRLAKTDNPSGAPPAPNANNALMPVRPATTTSGETPAPSVAQAVPMPPPAPPVAQDTAPAPTVAPRVMSAIPVAEQTPPPVASGQAVGTDVKLKPFMGGSQGTVASTTSGRWQTYKPGQMPRGKLVGVSDARGLASADIGAEPLYLHGDFTVTAAVGNSAVLRTAGNDPNGATTTANTRVVVQFPSGNRPPDQGSSVTRHGDRPFLITNIRQTPDGQVNIYVREVTTEQ